MTLREFLGWLDEVGADYTDDGITDKITVRSKKDNDRIVVSHFNDGSLHVRAHGYTYHMSEKDVKEEIKLHFI